tara:strand:- start:6683 stop:6916 length:234 start_codon:yes stop_codon:yes gene_type:complete
MVINIYIQNMGNAISKAMDYLGKKIEAVRKGSPRYRNWKSKWKNKKDIENYKMVRGEDYCEDEIYTRDEFGVQVVQL